MVVSVVGRSASRSPRLPAPIERIRLTPCAEAGRFCGVRVSMACLPATLRNAAPLLRSCANFSRNSRLAPVSTVERLRNRRRAAHLTEGQNLHLEVAASFFTSNRSPARTSRAALARCPLHSSCRCPHARRASVRVLKNRAAHSHLSILTPVIIPIYNNRDEESTSSKVYQLPSNRVR